MQQNDSVAEAMKLGMRQLASGVCIIAIEDGNGEKHAMTATSVTSVSDSPASLLVCVNKIHRINLAFLAKARFSVNVLSKSQQDVSNACADSTQSDQRFESSDWCFAAGQAPWLAGALAAFQCECEQIVPYGTHDIVIGKIVSAQSTPLKNASSLIYYNGAYTHLP